MLPPLSPARHVIDTTLRTLLFLVSISKVASFSLEKPERNSQPLPKFLVINEERHLPVQPTYLFHPSSHNSTVFALTCSSVMDLPPTTNFLATQVWPSARAAAMAIQHHLRSHSKSIVCEFGCGPGLPSLAAAIAGAVKVYATDIDETALALVQEASKLQKVSHVVEPVKYDLVNSYMDELPHADLYLFSDVFESAQVAEGVARITAELLMRGRSKVWVFGQSDRSQRDVFLSSLQQLLKDDSLVWTPMGSSSIESCNSRAPLQYFDSLWLNEIDESAVKYC